MLLRPLSSTLLALRGLSSTVAASSSSSGRGSMGPRGEAAAPPTSSTSNGGASTSDFKPLKLSYTCMEDKRKEVERKGPLVIHHSLLGCRKNWRKVAKEIHHLTHRKVVNLDARNHGESPRSGDMSYSLLAKDVQFLIKHLGEEKVSYMGHSMGGRVGMILALTQPQLIDKLICVDSTPVNTPVSLDRWETLGRACRRLQVMERQLRAKRGIHRAIFADELLRPILPNSRDRSLFITSLLVTKVPEAKKSKGSASETSAATSDGSESESEAPSGTSGREGEEEGGPLWRINVDALLKSPQMPASFPSFSGVTFDGPCMFIAGENSKFMRREHEGEIKKLFPNSEFVWLEGKGAGHWIHEDRHEEFMQATVPFLENQPQR